MQTYNQGPTTSETKMHSKPPGDICRSSYREGRSPERGSQPSRFNYQRTPGNNQTKPYGHNYRDYNQYIPNYSSYQNPSQKGHHLHNGGRPTHPNRGRGGN